MPEIDITCQGVLKLLQNLKPNKAPGPDEISPRVLKTLAPSIAPSLTLIFRHSLFHGYVPQDWRQALVTPIFKKGNRSAPENYRPVSLTCICCKVMEHIITSNVMKHAREHNILSDMQHGFRDKRSCETQLIGFVDDLARSVDKGQQVDIVVMDFAKAFDKVEHTRLGYKLRNYGIGGKTNKWIESFLSGRTQRVVLDGESSREVDVLSGVPQGSVLGPCLFLFYINDISNNIKSNLRLFADDTILYATVTSEAQGNLQADLDELAAWEEKWLMAFHPAKCEVMSISQRKQVVTRDYYLRGHKLQRTMSTKYLGVHLP